MSEYIIKGETLTGIADAIRTKDGTTEPIPAGSMAQRIIDIPTGNLEAEAMLAGLIDGTITEVVIPEGTTEIRKYAFSGCQGLSAVSGAEGVKTCGVYAFDRCSALTSIQLPNLETVSNYSFGNCTSLLGIELPKLKFVEGYAFSGCSKLKTVDLHVATSIKTMAFSGCYELDTLILRPTEWRVSLDYANAIASTKIKAGTGYVYVPASRIDSYKISTNWSGVASQFRVLEDYTVDGTVTGELDESKI